MTDRTYRVMYYVGRKALEGNASLTQDVLIIIAPTSVELPLRELHDAELFRLHGLGRCIRISHAKGTNLLVTPEQQTH